MPDTDTAGTLTANEQQLAALPVMSIPAPRDVPGAASVLLARLQSTGVVSRQWRAVQQYLERNPDLAAVLPAICEQARQEFARPDELAIELYRDPEIKDEYLTLYVRQPRYEADLMARIERLSDALGEQTASASGYLLLTTDFSAPRGSDAL